MLAVSRQTQSNPKLWKKLTNCDEINEKLADQKRLNAPRLPLLRHSVGEEIRSAISPSVRTDTTKKSGDGERRVDFYGHHPFNYSDPVVDRRTTNLAVQRRLGLLSDWRSWSVGSDRFDSHLVQTRLTCIASKSFEIW